MGINKAIDYIRDEEHDSFKTYLDKGIKYKFRAVFSPLWHYDEAIRRLEGTDIILAGAIDFPDGMMPLESKMQKFCQYADKGGYDEIDYVVNQAALANRDFDYIETEMRTISNFCHAEGMKVKAIVEMCTLEDDVCSKQRVCEIALKTKVDFLKTSTGKRSSGAKLNDVKLMKSVLGDQVKIKAAGGIRSYADATAFLEAGADVIGASAAIKITEESNS